MIMTIMMRTGAVLAAMGVCCLVAFELIGSTVDEDGTLHEPFGLIPIGLLLFGVAMLLLLAGAVKWVWLRRHVHK
ncbi:DUF3955 domain-containing protein [Aeromonas allosaccharophila]|uniref:DUF3955 domain-containing protein n=1 Tax=Aeromonas allosaccharophila TaxID=656 RepID=UPI00214AACDD|nr:DUF3955 domain-containing protein [Aeromonas allosaccharophila]